MIGRTAVSGAPGQGEAPAPMDGPGAFDGAPWDQMLYSGAAQTTTSGCS